jgi:succinate dehydrogenase/fumarate reductase flavoprotein subunit
MVKLMAGNQGTNVSKVLLIGSGSAGLRAAIAVYQAGREVVVVGKRLSKDAHTVADHGQFRRESVQERL